MKTINVLLILVIGIASTNVLARSAGQFDDVKPFLREIIPHSSSNKAACPENYAPCTCELTTNGLEVVCLDVPVADIRLVFRNTRATNLYSVDLTASNAATVALPFDLLADKTTQRLSLNCLPAADPKPRLTIDVNTFEFTRRYTNIFSIKDCDLADVTNLNFLDGFDVLTTLRFERVVSLVTLGSLFFGLDSLDQLKELAVINSTGLDLGTFPDTTPARLERLYLNGNGLTDTVVNSILIAVGGSSSTSSLQELNLANNILTKVPRVGSFSSLNSLDLANNQIAYASQSALIFPSQSGVNFVGMKKVGLTAIEDGAFVGDFTRAQVNLEENGLTAFREGVFKDMLTQMVIQPPSIGGQLIVTGNPFECGCGLAWLIRDNRDLIPAVTNGVCGGFFKFEQLNPDAYLEC